MSYSQCLPLLDDSLFPIPPAKENFTTYYSPTPDYLLTGMKRGRDLINIYPNNYPTLRNFSFHNSYGMRRMK